MRRFTTAFGCAVILNLLIANSDSRAQDRDDPRMTERAASSEIQLNKYRQLCADCHGTDGRGKEYRESGIPIPDFTSKSWGSSKSVAQLRLAILLGKGEDMPPFEEELSTVEANQMVSLIQKLAGLGPGSEREDALPGSLKLRKELERFQLEWSQLKDLWEEQVAALAAQRSIGQRSTTASPSKQ